MSGERARLFVALTLDAATCGRLVAWAREALGGQPGVRRLDADALHLTLCFLGAVELAAVDAIAAALSQAIDGTRAARPEFVVQGVRWLPPRRPRVCAVELGDRDGRAAAVQAAISEQLSDGGWYAPERRGWLPHVTVARVGRGGRPDRAVQVGRGGRPDRAVIPAPPQLEPFPASAVTLMRSWPGSRYERLSQIAL